MTLIEFKAQMQIITETFGANEYTQPRLQIIWEHCQDLSLEQFRQIVRHFLESKSVKYPPLPNEFRDQAIIQRKASFKGNSQQQFKHDHHPADLESSQKVIKQILAQYGVTKLSDIPKKWGKR